MIYKIVIEGQNLEVSEEVATSDERVKDMLKPYWPDVVNAAISRAAKDDVTTITVVKRAGTKGLFPGPLDFLIAMPEGENPAAAKAREFIGLDPDKMTVAERLQVGGEAQAAIGEGERQADMMREARERMREAVSGGAGVLPVGF